MMNFRNFVIVILSLFVSSCGNNFTEEQQKYAAEVEKSRSEKDGYMRDDPGSPFNARSKVEFKPLNYFEVDPEFKLKSRLTEYDTKDTVTIFGTKGEERKVIKHGYLDLTYNSFSFKVNVYQGTTKTGEKYYSIWFTDKTTGEETYGVGRYIDFELNPDSNFIYTVDFNLAYSPYCSYSPDYSCAIPSKEDHIDLAIEAGEKNFH